GYVYGRGVTDDKGAVIASLYAIKYLLDTGYKFKKRVRLIVGCNEESGSRCIKHYVEKEGHIDYGFTPDADFPGIYGEKGMVGGLFAGKSDKILDIKGGDASNVVCKKVTCTLKPGCIDENKLDIFFKEHNINYEFNDNVLTVYGKAAHASLPDLGVNAINYLMCALYAAGIDDEFVSNFDKYIGLSLHGEKLGLEEVKDDVTNTSINIGLAFVQDENICLSIDCRFPIKTNKQTVVPYFEKMENFKLVNAIDPLYFDVNSPFIRALEKAYRDVTGDNQSKMQAIGGGTYAKSIHNCIAFGPEFIGEVSNIHDANECLSIESLKKATMIYIEAIKNLNEL
ncbi:MAG: Sapep family Mn(2+)-dependent dipeptidase, partial [Erysipelotrichaceae bacterium]